MDAREFLKTIIENMPSRGLDNVDIYIDEIIDDDCISYKIVDISNSGSNDGLFIRIEKV